MKKKILIIFYVFLEVYLLFNSIDVINSFKNNLNIIIYTLMPSMFFSVLFTNILLKLEFYKYIPKFLLKFFSKILNINYEEVTIILLSIFGGFPINSKLLINNKNINNIIIYTSFVSPIYFFTTVNKVYLKNFKTSLTIYLSLLLSNLLIGYLVRNKNNNYKTKKEENVHNDIYFSSLKETIITLSNIFSNILFFSILISLLNNIIKNKLINNIICGLLEFSSGIYLISYSNISLFLKGLIITFFISFNSFSIHMQLISINEKIKYKKYLLYRIINIIISVIIYFILNILISY